MEKIFRTSLELIGSVINSASEPFKERPMYNESFVSRFSNEEDKRKLEETVRELKMSGDTKSKTIVLKNNDKVTIVVK